MNSFVLCGCLFFYSPSCTPSCEQPVVVVECQPCGLLSRLFSFLQPQQSAPVEIAPTE